MAEGEKKSAALDTPVQSAVPILTPARLHTIIIGLWFCLFISAIDTTIVTTALVKISSEFNSFEQAAWLVTAYLLTYNSFLMITAKLSDVWGLKTLLLSCAVIFLIFSMACGAAQTMLQLIVFRALQGIGGSGLYSLTFVSIMKMLEPEKIGFYSGVISSVFAVANLLGPLLGGIIADRTTWRWIFFINGPVVAIAMALLFFSMPVLKDGKSHSERLRGLDSFGGLLSISWPIPLIFALQEAGVSHAWSSGVIIGTLVTGIVILILFGLYETWVTYRTNTDPIFPIRLLRNPPMALTLLSQFLLGMPFYVIFVQLPQRFQTVNFTSAERAGILLLPATLVSPVGAMFSGIAAKKIPIEIILIVSTSVVTIAIGLLSSLPTYEHVWPGMYGYEILIGLGLGLTSPPYFMMIATSVRERDIAVATGALNMVRTLGGCVAVAICSAVHREYLNGALPALLSPEQIAQIGDSNGFVTHLPEPLKSDIGNIFGRSYNKQFHVMLAFTGLNVIVTIILALVRKRMGSFGMTPGRTESNEFMKAADNVQKDEEVGRQQGGSISTPQPQPELKENDCDRIAITLDNKQKV